MLSATSRKRVTNSFIWMAAAGSCLCYCAFGVDMLTVGQGCFYGMVMELETFSSMVINHLIVWFSLFIFFFRGSFGRIIYFPQNPNFLSGLLISGSVVKKICVGIPETRYSS